MKKYLTFGHSFLCILVLTLIGCSAFDKSFGFRGPIVVTIATKDGKQPEAPFLIKSAHVEYGGHGGSGHRMGYLYERIGDANQPILFPREHLDLKYPNAYALIHFEVYHPMYHINYSSAGFAPSKADDPIPFAVEVAPLEAVLARIEKEAERASLAMEQLAPDSSEYYRQSSFFEEARYSLGTLVSQHIYSIKTDYLPVLPKEIQKAVREKYNPIFKELYYRYPETDCWRSVTCQEQIKKPRVYEYNGL
ncbi:hypothetical protein [Pseudoalteromonas piscicida]|uniref:hypothetical protein n=1 Tax=Pseudoalteromonas piscicida TaxID=43662 RepID=UPI001C9820D5|nr:hypothetical protein [Pseudoalteromonas piscicida]QZO14892.1 hypothetical protein K5642_21685 [Pseudoalteromonas piscicida]